MSVKHWKTARSHFQAMLLVALLALSGCALFEQDVEPPPRSNEPIEIPEGFSVVAADIEIALGQIRRSLEGELPTHLWSINRPDAQCVGPKQTRIIGITLKSPTIRCDLTGQVTRGAIALRGRGDELIVTMPIHAEVTASNIAGIVKHETAKAQANVTARVRVSINPDWSAQGRVSIDYNWTQPPTIDLLGQKLTFANQADKRLKKLVRRLERTLEQEIARLDLRSQIEPVWERAFTVQSLNEKDPSVWLRLTPQALSYNGYSASQNSLLVKMRLDASTEVIVGEKPLAPEATTLPDQRLEAAPDAQLALTIPVIAQYSQLVPVIERALAKRAERVFVVPAMGDRMIEILSVNAYGTTDNRIAVGVEFEAWLPGERRDSARGVVWLTARPTNATNSRTVRFVDLEYQMETTRFTSNVLLEIAKMQDFSSAIEGALTQNFEDDYDGLLHKVDAEIAQRRLGDFIVTTQIDKVNTGVLMAYGEGLFLPVSANGATEIRYAPD